MALTAGPTPVVAVLVKLRLRKVRPRPAEVPKLTAPVASFDVMTTSLSDTAEAEGPEMVSVWVPATVTAL